MFWFLFCSIFLLFECVCVCVLFNVCVTHSAITIECEEKNHWKKLSTVSPWNGSNRWYERLQPAHKGDDDSHSYADCGNGDDDDNHDDYDHKRTLPISMVQSGYTSSTVFLFACRYFLYKMRKKRHTTKMKHVPTVFYFITTIQRE